MTDRDSAVETSNSSESILLSDPQLGGSDLVRGCYVEIINSSECIILSYPQVYLDSGVCSAPLSLNIKPHSDGKATFYKTSGAATGSVGVFTYNLSDHPSKDHNNDQLKLAVMFSVPFNRLQDFNIFAVGLFDSKTKCNYDLYQLMYDGKDDRFVRGEGGGSAIQYKGANVVIDANMSDTTTAVLRVEVSDYREKGGHVKKTPVVSNMSITWS